MPAAALFQSLVGRLKTLEGEKRLNIFTLFQSLVGRLKTQRDEGILVIGGWFQSLVGRLKTLICVPLLLLLSIVSIPRR